MNRISRLTVAAGVVFLSRNIQAQNVNYGVQVGSNFAVQSDIGGIYDNDEIKPGLNIGVFGSYSLTDKFSLQTEFSYDQKGSGNEDFSNHYNYFSIPVLAKYNLHGAESNSWTLDCYAGPYAAFLLNAESVFENNEYDNVDLSYNTNNAEFGIQYGFMVKYPIKDNSILFNLKFGMGLTPYDENDSDSKNKYVGIGLGYEF
ncbi:MAG: porin family protein [Salinivirgaceae bacterium]|jgi:predicted porin|nr:porin family protein [Salinivirgaceae bacterium]